MLMLIYYVIRGLLISAGLLIVVLLLKIWASDYRSGTGIYKFRLHSEICHCHLCDIT